MGITLTQGQSGAFSVEVVGAPPLTFRWRKDDSPLSDTATMTGSGTSTLRIASAVSDHAGGYDVVVSNASGSATSAVATLSVRAITREDVLRALRLAGGLLPSTPDDAVQWDLERVDRSRGRIELRDVLNAWVSSLVAEPGR